jgi:hypothetical protein
MGYLRRFRHLAAAIGVLAGGAVAVLFLALDIGGAAQLVLPGVGAVPTSAIALFVVLGTALFAAGKLAEAYNRVDELTGEERTYAGAPIITWTDPRVTFTRERAIVFNVMCENAGPIESVATYLAFGCEERRNGGAREHYKLQSDLNKWHPIKSHKLGDEHKFMIETRAPDDRAVGEREIVWWMTYSDRSHPQMAYFTQASLRVICDRPGAVEPPIADTVFLDATSTPKERRQRYLDGVAGRR